MKTTTAPIDPLRVLATTEPVVATARFVEINAAAIESVAAAIARLGEAPAGWSDDLHFRDGTWRTAGWVLALDALNFCFWSAVPDPNDRWRVEWRGAAYDGYWALAAALRRAVDEGFQPWEPGALANLTDREVAHLLRPGEPGSPEIPLLAARAAN